MDSYLQIPGSGRHVEALAWNPTAWVKAAADHPRAPPMRNCGGKGSAQSLLGCPPASKGIQTCMLHALRGPYYLPLAKKEDSLQWEEENHLLHNLKLKFQSWGCTFSLYTAAVSRTHTTVCSPSPMMTASWTSSSTPLTWVLSSTTARPCTRGALAVPVSEFRSLENRRVRSLVWGVIINTLLEKS